MIVRLTARKISEYVIKGGRGGEGTRERPTKTYTGKQQRAKPVERLSATVRETHFNSPPHRVDRATGRPMQKKGMCQLAESAVRKERVVVDVVVGVNTLCRITVIGR